MCKCREALSLAVLIGRGLDHKILWSAFCSITLTLLNTDFSLIPNLYSVFRALRKRRNAPLAQLVEHLTLNQGVPGSSP